MKFKSYLKLIWPYRNKMIIIIVLALMISLITGVTPFVNQVLIDNGLLSLNVYIVVRYVLILAFLQFAVHLIEYMQRKQEMRIANDLGKKLKCDVFRHGLMLKPKYFKDQNFYNRISDAMFDITNIMNIVNSSFLTIIIITFKCIGATIGLIVLDWRLTLIVLALLPIKFCINIYMRKRTEKCSTQVLKTNKEYNKWMSNIITGINDIKLWGLENNFVSQCGNHISEINDASEKSSIVMVENNIVVRLFEHVLMYVLYIIGAVLITGNKLSVGGLMAFITFSTYLSNPVNIIMELRIALKQIMPSIHSLESYYNLEEEEYTGKLPLSQQISLIEFKNVTVKYEGRIIFENLSFKVKRGEKIAIVGDNGSGKTTIINLLLRLIEPTEGEILIDGVSIDEYDIESYRKHFSVVNQSVHLFYGSIMDNINLAASKEDIEIEPELDFCTYVIESWENNYYTQVGSDGTKLSGGERQKVALLRALQRKTDVLVLDEPTANYDKESEDAFNKYICCSNSYGFYFLITHRSDVLENMDQIISL